MFEWCVVNVDIRTDTKTQIISLKEIGLRASNLLTILASMVNILGGPI